jgi:hypothetical protein
MKATCRNAFGLSVLLLCLMAGGCSVTKVSKGDVSAWNVRLFWQTEALHLHYATNAFSLELSKSGGDTKAAGDILGHALKAYTGKP